MFVKVIISMLLVEVFSANSQKCNKTDSLTFERLDDVPDFDFDPCVTSVEITFSDIDDFEDGAFNNLPNLKKLNLQKNQIPPENLFSFGSIPSLEYLSLYLQITNTRGRGMIIINHHYPNLEILRLSSVQAREVSFENWTALMPNLKDLDMSYNKIVDFSDLKRNVPPKLASLTLLSNDISFFNLSGYSTLIDVHLSFNKFKSLLITDNPRNCQTADQLCIGCMSNLRTLSASESKIEVIDFNYVSSEPLPKLAELWLNDNLIKTINYLSRASLFIPILPSLNDLSLSGNKLKSIEILCPFRTLTSLNLNGVQNPSFSIELSEHIDECLTNLRNFNFNQNWKSYSMKEISKRFFSKLKNLNKLSINNHELTDLTGLPTTLTTLSVRGNKIELAKNLGLENLTALRLLYIGGNPVATKINETYSLEKSWNIYYKYISETESLQIIIDPE